MQVGNTKILVIFVRNPADYLKDANFPLRLLLKLNDRFYHTPLSISDNSLQCSFEELIRVVRERIDKYRADF
jgi:hypothetical protein